MNTSEEEKGLLTVPGTLRGYREWRLYPSIRNALYPVSSPGQWFMGEVNIASCIFAQVHHPHTSAPASGCTCGFYGKHQPFDLYEYNSLMQMFHRRLPPDYVIVRGSIQASGRIIVGTKGFRAEKACIEALSGDELYNFARMTRLPWFPSMEELVAAFPPDNVSELLVDKAHNYG